jgi:hypothetical protein
MVAAKAKVQLVETPSQQMKAATQFEVTDERGRVFVLAKPDVLAQFRLVEALGETAMNQAYMGMVFPLLFIRAIDGEAVSSLHNKLEVEALIKRLDEDGIQAVTLGVHEHFAQPSEAALKNG